MTSKDEGVLVKTTSSRLMLARSKTKEIIRNRCWMSSFFLCGTAAVVNMILLTLFVSNKQEKATDGICWIDPANSQVSTECVYASEGATYLVVNIANVTLKDGSVHSCNKYHIQGSCENLFNDGEEKEVLAGERRECLYYPDSDHECVEPSFADSWVAIVVVIWVFGACCVCMCWAPVFCYFCDGGTSASEVMNIEAEEIGPSDTSAVDLQKADNVAESDLRKLAKDYPKGDMILP